MRIYRILNSGNPVYGEGSIIPSHGDLCQEFEDNFFVIHRNNDYTWVARYGDIFSDTIDAKDHIEAGKIEQKHQETLEPKKSGIRDVQVLHGHSTPNPKVGDVVHLKEFGNMFSVLHGNKNTLVICPKEQYDEEMENIEMENIAQIKKELSEAKHATIKITKDAVIINTNPDKLEFLFKRVTGKEKPILNAKDIAETIAALKNTDINEIIGDCVTGISGRAIVLQQELKYRAIEDKINRMIAEDNAWRAAEKAKDWEFMFGNMDRWDKSIKPAADVKMPKKPILSINKISENIKELFEKHKQETEKEKLAKVLEKEISELMDVEVTTTKKGFRIDLKNYKDFCDRRKKLEIDCILSNHKEITDDVDIRITSSKPIINTEKVAATFNKEQMAFFGEMMEEFEDEIPESAKERKIKKLIKKLNKLMSVDCDVEIRKTKMIDGRKTDFGYFYTNGMVYRARQETKTSDRYGDYFVSGDCKFVIGRINFDFVYYDALIDSPRP